ncbi:hypothetical protein O181_080921, partial [Austropuccinia psidii MF-1]|nr:hypothetical protein [Austropuccinia psidii MF-1]
FLNSRVGVFLNLWFSSHTSSMARILKDPTPSHSLNRHLHLGNLNQLFQSQNQLQFHQRNLIQTDSQNSKRARSASPLDERLYSAKKRLLINSLKASSSSPSKITTAYTNLNHFTTSLSIGPLKTYSNNLQNENMSPEDIEMAAGSSSLEQNQKNPQKEKDNKPKEIISTTLLPISSTNLSYPPLHRPHPFAYQQHMALRMNRARKTLSSNTEIINNNLQPRNK